jgi:hypothetical protein
MTKKIIVASHRRSGTHLAIDSIANNIPSFRNAPPISSVTLDHLSTTNKWDLTPKEFARTIYGKYALLKTHSHGNILDFFVGDEELKDFVKELFAETKIIYVHRDGRDVMVSLYYYERNFNKVVWEQSFSEYLRGTNSFDTQTYKNEIDRVGYWAFHVNSWIMKRNILLVSYDDLQHEYAATLQIIADFIDEPLDDDIRDIRRHAFDSGFFSELRRRISRQVGSVRTSSVDFRRGMSGDWKSHFSNDDLSYFIKRGGDLNRRLGYD